MEDAFEMPVSSKSLEAYGVGINGVPYETQEIYAAHAINCHDELVQALSDILDTQRGTSGRIIIERHQEDDLIALIKKVK